MAIRGLKSIVILAGAGILTGGAATAVLARQNIVIGEISVHYDHQDRTYDHTRSVPVDNNGNVVAEDLGTPADGNSTRVILLEDRTGDRRDYILTPRLTYSSTGITDTIELTYAPGVHYDHLDESTDIDQDFGLHAEKNLNRNWLVTLDNRYFLGDDSLHGNERRTADIVPASGEAAAPEPTVGSPAAEPDQALTERFGRRRYWTNTMDISTDYTYGEDRTFSVGYNFDVLRNDNSDQVGGYTDYDRHTGDLQLHHRFNRKWSAEGEARYSRGLFDEPDVLVVTPSPTATPPDEETPAVQRLTGIDSEDLKEYNFRIRGGYDTSSHYHLFTEYSYLGTDYDSSLRQDSDIHNVALGFDYDISQRLHVTLSGGPSWVVRDNSSTETDYNAYGGATWDFLHGTATVFAGKSYVQDNFDGRGSGLTDSWDTGVTLDYQLTRDLTATVSANYNHDQRQQLPLSQTVIVVDQEQPAPAGTVRDEYTEKDYDAGFSLSYTFLRWYTLSSGYRYYNHDSDLTADGADSYHEHRAFIELAVSKELFRW